MEFLGKIAGFMLVIPFIVATIFTMILVAIFQAPGAVLAGFILAGLAFLGITPFLGFYSLLSATMNFAVSYYLIVNWGTPEAQEIITVFV